MISKILPALVLVLRNALIEGLPDLTPAAITVYRNPEFFKNLNHPTGSYNGESAAGEYPDENYKYPGETKTPNTPVSIPDFEVTYDDSPEFRHEPRDIFPTTFVPGRGRGPYGTRQNKENGLEENFEETADYGEYRVNESAEGDEDEENFAGGGESYSDDGDEENHRPGNGFYNSNFEEDFGDDRGSLFDSSERFNSGQSFFNDFTSGSAEEFDGFHSNYFSRLNSRYETSPGQDSHEDGEF